MGELHALPTWPTATVGFLATAGLEPHVIPVSTAVRAGERRLVLALARSRGSLARLRADGRVSLCLIAGDGLAVSAEGPARILRERLERVPAVAAVSLDAERILDHHQPTYEITAGVAWRWTDEHARRRDEQVRAELAELARHPGGGSEGPEGSR